MKRSQKRLLVLVASIVGVLIIAALLYMAGMDGLEGKPRGFWQSLEWAAETLSTTGYGADSAWSHPVMVTFVVVVQFLGVFLVFLIFPIYLIPFLEERFETRLPADCANARDHILIYRNGPAIASLLEELQLAGVATVIIEEDEAEARRVQESGNRVVYGNIDARVMSRVALSEARALILNSSDHRNAAVAIIARQLGFERDILALVEDPLHRQPIMLAGATAAYTPRHVLGAALAARASRSVSPTVDGVQNLGSKLLVCEVRISPASGLAGQTLAKARLGENAKVTVIGQWVGGKLNPSPTPDMRIEAGGILILVGSVENIERFTEISEGTTAFRRDGPFLIAGHGEVGRKVAQLLQDAGEDVRVIAREADTGVDVVGNVLDPELLESAGVKSAQAVVLALSEDATTLFATVILKDLAAEVPVIARVNSPENVERIHAAGVDFALSISQVTGQILARKLLGKQSVSLDEDLKVSMVSSPVLDNGQPAELRIRERTGCSVVAVERGDELLMQFDRGFRFAPGDAVYICGSEENTRRFVREFREADVHPG